MIEPAGSGRVEGQGGLLSTVCRQRKLLKRGYLILAQRPPILAGDRIAVCPALRRVEPEVKTFGVQVPGQRRSAELSDDLCMASHSSDVISTLCAKNKHILSLDRRSA